MASWNPDFFHSQPGVVFGVPAQFWAHVAAVNSGHSLVRRYVSDLHNERHDTIVILIYDTSSEADNVSTIKTHISRPPFCRGNGR